MKLKALLPTLREKKRYIVFEVISKGIISQKAAHQAISIELQRFLGEFGMAKAGVIILKDWVKNKGILRVSNKEVDTVKSAIMLAKGKDFAFKTIAVSGSLNKLRNRIKEE
ncbi:MAG: Rpp14/Pop5 family protein [archaeon]